MKKITCFMLMLVIAFALTACGSNDLQQHIDDLENQIGQKTDKSDTDDLLRQIADLENQTEQQAEKIVELENELERMKTHDDFALTISVNSSFATKGQTITVNAALKNQSGESHNIAYRRLMNCVIPGWSEDGEPIEPELPPSIKFILFENDTTINYSFNIFVSDQEPDIYELTVYGLFYLNFDPDDEQTWLEDEENAVAVCSSKVAIIINANEQQA